MDGVMEHLDKLLTPLHPGRFRGGIFRIVALGIPDFSVLNCFTADLFLTFFERAKKVLAEGAGAS